LEKDLIYMADLIQPLRDIYRDEFQRFLALGVILLALYSMLFVAIPSPVHSAPEFSQNTSSNLTIYFFYSSSCPHCRAQSGFNQQLAIEYPQAKWSYHEMSEVQNQFLLAKLLNERNATAAGVPVTIAGSSVIVGFDEASSPARLRGAISAELHLPLSNTTAAPSAGPAAPLLPSEFDLPLLGKIQTSSLSLPFLTILLGLIDGFNPCAMWVLLFLISATLTLHDRRRLALIVGTFLLASGILYFLFMTFWLNAMLMVGLAKPVMVAIGAFALFWGFGQLREFVKNRGQIACHVGDIGEKKRIRSQIEELLAGPLTWATLVGLVVLAFSVNSIEFVCSSAIPLAYTNFLVLQNLPSWQYYGYILLYVLFFMIDDLIVFSLAIFATSGTVGDKIASWGHLIGALILIALGGLLLFAPQLLMAG